MSGQSVIVKSDAAILKIGSILSVLSGAVLFCLAIFVTAEVISRFFFNKPISGVVEIGQIMMAYIIFFAQSYTLGIKGHITSDFFTMKMSRRGQLLSEAFSFLIGLFIIALFAYGSVGYFWFSWTIKETEGTMITIYTFIGKFAMLVGMVLMSLQYLTQLMLVLVKLTGKEV